WDSACNYSLHEIRRRAKCRRNFARIEDADATAAASADVKQAATIPERSSHHFNGFGKLRSCCAQRILNEFLFRDKELDQVMSAHLFQVLRARIALLGKRSRQIFDFFLRELWQNCDSVARLCCKPRRAQFGMS